MPPKIISDDILERTNNKSYNGQSTINVIEKLLNINQNEQYDSKGNYNIYNKFNTFNSSYNNNNQQFQEPAYYKSKETYNRIIHN